MPNTTNTKNARCRNQTSRKGGVAASIGGRTCLEGGGAPQSSTSSETSAKSRKSRSRFSRGGAGT
eukprot:13859592-Alexandrium_andersonii.AAC.1